MSHPAWVCGLKLARMVYVIGALRSHPAWVCGLKHWSDNFAAEFKKSHPAWVCGLKQTCIVITIYYSSHTLRGCVD